MSIQRNIGSAMNGHEQGGHRLEPFGEKRRLETQIHRRRKVKAFSPLELEWESPNPGGGSFRASDKATATTGSMPGVERQEEPNHSTVTPLSDRHT